MILDSTKLNSNMFEQHDIQENEYFNVILRDSIEIEYEKRYLGKLLKTLRVKNNELIVLPNIERKVKKASQNEIYDKYFIFDKFIDEESNEFSSNNSVNSNKTLNVKYKYICVPKVANVQLVSGIQTMMGTFTIKTSFPIYLKEYYKVDDYDIKTTVVSNYNELYKEYENRISIIVEDLFDFEGNTLELNDVVYLYKDANKTKKEDDLLIDLKINIYRSDTSIGD